MLIFSLTGSFQVGKSQLLKIREQNTTSSLANEHVNYLFNSKYSKTLRQVKFNQYDSVSLILTGIIDYPIDTYWKYLEKYPLAKEIPFDIQKISFKPAIEISNNRIYNLDSIRLDNSEFVEVLSYYLQSKANIFANESDYNKFVSKLLDNFKQYRDKLSNRQLELNQSLESIVKHKLEKLVSYADVIRILTVLIAETLREFSSYESFGYARQKLIEQFLDRLKTFELSQNNTTEILIYYYVYSFGEFESISDSKVQLGKFHLDFDGIFPNYTVGINYSKLPISEKQNKFNLQVQKYNTITNDSNRQFGKQKEFKKKSNWMVVNKLSKRDELITQLNYSLLEFLNL